MYYGAMIHRNAACFVPFSGAQSALLDPANNL